MSDYFVQLSNRQSDRVFADKATSATHDEVASLNATAQHRAYELDLILRSGLFEAGFYLTQYPDVAAAAIDPLQHFYDFGFREGRRPNLYFDPLWYLGQNPDVEAAGVHPLSHYLSYGDLEGRRPSLLFDPVWYREANALPATECALAHYLVHRKSSRVSPIPDFDISHYARLYPDVIAAEVDPFEHFVTYGYREGRTPSVNFDGKFYSARYLKGDAERNPFLHYLEHKHEPGIYGRMPEEETTIPREIRRFSRPSPEFEEFSPLAASAPRRAKVLAYYLPQFHASPENDLWWGKGFTEWTNLPRGVPRFRGHYQPRVPRDLGFYSLDHADVMRHQVEMAKGGGIYGFVFYYYSFNGKRLLDKPLQAFLSDSEISMPFCLMWANENWTRRWDGADAEILISQDYRPEDEPSLLASFAEHFRDPRYIRIQGRPLLMIYRPGLMADGRQTLLRWREFFHSQFNENPLLIMGQTFQATDPTILGLDGAIEFPPHKLTQNLTPINTTLEYLDLEFRGNAYRYDDVVAISLDESNTPYPLIKTAVPSWDNDARRQGSGLVLTESTPQKYQKWLGELVDRAVKNPFFGEPLVCVNAWNEWCEGAYLEPDVHFGSAYLNATSRAVVGRRVEGSDGRLLLIGHDGFPGGAQQLLLHIGGTLRSHFGVEVTFLLLDGGKLEPAYRELGTVLIGQHGAALDLQLRALHEKGFQSAIANTSASAAVLPALKKAGFDVTLLVHELPRLLREKNLVSGAREAARLADRIVFPAAFVRDQWLRAVDSPREDNLLTIPQGLYQKSEIDPTWRTDRRRELGIQKNARLVIGVGYADLRKGFDLFLQLWRLVRGSSKATTHFCWVGDVDPDIREYMGGEIQDAERTGTFHMPGFRKDVPALLSAADVFVLTSREDPFPSVVLEALHCGLPAVVFDRSGGIPDVLRAQPLGHVVPFGDTIAMARVITAIADSGTSEEVRKSGRKLVDEVFSFRSYVWRLIGISQPSLPAISVAVPNYNYAHHMPARLSSIFLQNHPIKEILVLDDCSPDNSLEVVKAVATEWRRHITIVPNEVNSGSVFRQWRKAAERASGDYIWIAEADDLSAPKFLTDVVSLMLQDPAVRFAFCDSSAVDSVGQLIWESYKGYYSTVKPNALSQTGVFDAAAFVREFLSVKNLIVNVSAVIWRREALLRAMDECSEELLEFKMAGDWRLYLQALSGSGARVGYWADALNVHRRHSASVTHSLDADRHVAEIAACHAVAVKAFTLDGQIKMKQEAYIREVSDQLGGKKKSNSKKNGKDAGTPKRKMA